MLLLVPFILPLDKERSRRARVASMTEHHPPPHGVTTRRGTIHSVRPRCTFATPQKIRDGDRSWLLPIPWSAR